MRQSWTDERLDDFSRNVDLRFDRLEQKVDDGFRDLRTEMREMRTEMRELRELRAQLVAFQRVMVQFAGVLIAALIGLVFTQVLG